MGLQTQFGETEFRYMGQKGVFHGYCNFWKSCTGKSTLAQVLAARVPCEVISGKDYLRLAKNENVAAALFRKKLQSALTGENIIYVISEKEHLALLP